VVGALDTNVIDAPTYSTTSPVFMTSGANLILRPGITLNFEAGPTSYVVTCTVSTVYGSFTNSFTVFVVNINEAPYALTYTASRTVVENFSPLFPTAGSNIGFVTPFDYEGGSYTYTLVDGGGGRLAMSGTTIYVAGAIDFETTPTLSLTVRVTDSGGLSFTNSFIIAVSNVNERPTSVSLSNLAVNEGVSGATVGTLAAADPDAGATFTFSLASNPN